jgi:hypothetical protein
VTEPPLGVTAPTPLIEALVALLLDQLRVEEPPDTMDVGLAEKDAVGGGTTVIVTCLMVEPPAPKSANE